MLLQQHAKTFKRLLPWGLTQQVNINLYLQNLFGRYKFSAALLWLHKNLINRTHRKIMNQISEDLQNFSGILFSLFYQARQFFVSKIKKTRYKMFISYFICLILSLKKTSLIYIFLYYYQCLLIFIIVLKAD